MQPLADLFSANMNAGLYHSAAISRFGFHIEFDLIVMGSLVGDDRQSYTATTPPRFNPPVFTTATVFGGQGSTVQNTNAPGISYRGPDGVFNTSMFPLFIPQLTVGNVLGTQAMVRFLTLPKFGSGSIPEGTLWSVGARHSISQWIPSLPLDVAASFSYGNLSVDWSEGGGQLIDYSGYTFGVQASKKFSALIVYGGLALDNSTMGISYQSTDPNLPGAISFDLKGANKFRATAGLCLSLGVFKLFADVNLGAVTHFSGGIGFGG